MNRTHLVFDLETVPDYDLYTAPEAQAGTERPIPPAYAHCPIVIGVLWLDHDYGFKRLGVVAEEKPVQSEKAMLEDFVGFVEKQRPKLVTYNGRGFDLPVLAQRCLRHGLPMPWYYRGKEYRYRYGDDGHLDLCDVLSDHGASRHISLDKAARLIGLPGKMDVDGSQVETLYRAGQLDVIRRYCLADVVQTAFLYLRFRLLQGDLSPARYREVAGALHNALVQDGRLSELLAQVEPKRLLLLD